MEIRVLEGLGSIGGQLDYVEKNYSQTMGNLMDLSSSFSGLGQIESKHITVESIEKMANSFLSKLREHFMTTIQKLNLNRTSSNIEFSERLKQLANACHNYQTLYLSITRMQLHGLGSVEQGYFEGLRIGINGICEGLGFFKKLAKKVGGAVKKVATAVKTVAKKTATVVKKAAVAVGKGVVTAVKAVAKFNPITLSIQFAIRKLLYHNVFNFGSKCGAGVLTDAQRREIGMSDLDYSKGKNAYNITRSIYNGVAFNQTGAKEMGWFDEAVRAGFGEKLKSQKIPYPKGLTIAPLSGLGLLDPVSITATMTSGAAAAASIFAKLKDIAEPVLKVFNAIKSGISTAKTGIDATKQLVNNPVQTIANKIGVTDQLNKINELKSNAEAQAKAQAQLLAQAKASAESQAKAQAQLLAQAKASAESQVKAQAQQTAQLLAQAKASAESQVKAQAKAQAQLLAQAKASAESQTKAIQSQITAVAQAQTKDIANKLTPIQAQTTAVAQAQTKDIVNHTQTQIKEQIAPINQALEQLKKPNIPMILIGISAVLGIGYIAFKK